MKSIFIACISNDSRGAKVIFTNFIDRLITKDNTGLHYYLFCTWDDILAYQSEKVSVIITKKKGIKDLLFKDRDFLKEWSLKNKITADLIVSMQNTTINYIKGVGQIVLYQNSIPLSDEKWNPLISSERVLFYYKHIYPYFVKRYINSQTIFIAPTNWVREKLILKFRIPAENVVTIYSEIHYSDIQSVVPQNFDRSYYHFFYPSNNSKHKNHSILLSALKMMRDDLNIDISKVKLHFTLNPDRDNYLIKIIKQYKLAYNIVFEGILSKQNMDSYYKASDAMLFPSLIESFGLPLVEAAQFGIPILSADLPYAREVICKYSGAVFLPPKNPSDWARNMAKCISEHPVYDPCRIKFNSGLDDFIRIIHKTF